MPFADHLIRLIAPLLHIPPDALDYFLATRHIGHGSETALPFPAELIPVGGRLVLRGWMNNTFFPTHRDWILPYWAERQFDPKDPGFMPRGFNLFTLNYTRRDWTMIGNLESEREAVVDPHGLVTPWYDGWSLDVWLEVDGALFTPSRLPDAQVEQSLHENLPIVRTVLQAAGMSVATEVYASTEQDGEWLVEQITLENPSGVARPATLYVSVRPFNAEGVSLVKDLEYCEANGQAAFFVNNALAVLMPVPDAAACSDLARGDVAHMLPALQGKPRAVDQAGLATGAAAFRLELEQGSPKTLTVRMPLRRVEREEPGFPQINLRAAPEIRAQVVSTWRGELARGMRVHLPDDILQNAFEANKAFLLLLHDGDSITPGPWTYHQFWLRDAAYLLNALDKLGYYEEAARVLDQLPRRLEKDGYMRATEGEWDSNGAAIWSMAEHARLSGDKEQVARHYWSLLRMAGWINSKRRKEKAIPQRRQNLRLGLERQEGDHPPHYGLLPSGPSAEHLGPADYYYWDDFWGLAGLRDAAEVATWLGQARDAERLRANFESFRKDVDASLAAAARRLGRPAMPASPYRHLDAGMVGSLVASYPLRLFEPGDPRIRDTIAALKEQAWLGGGYFNYVGHTALGTYLTLDIAECLLYQREPEAWKMIRWVLEHASPTFTWAEGLHPLTLRGGMGDGHHGWAIADFLIAVRNLLLLEEGNHLLITPVLPEEWTAENNVIKVEGAATYFGEVDYTIAFGERTGTLVLSGDWRQAPEYVEWDLPFSLREAGGDIEGVEIVGNAVRLPRQARRVVVMW